MPKIYTRTGDSGMTSLVDGSRQKKNSVRIEAYGTVDELNSSIGLIIASNPLTAADRQMLTAIQNRLFDIGSYLAAGSAEMSSRLLPALDEPICWLENEIDRIDETLPRHNRFVLPQGSPSCAAANMARTVARRAERRILSLADELAPDEAIAPAVIKYINRLSDYLFVLGRHCNLLASVTEIYQEP